VANASYDDERIGAPVRANRGRLVLIGALDSACRRAVTWQGERAALGNNPKLEDVQLDALSFVTRTWSGQVPDRLLDLLLHEVSRQRAEGLVQEVVLGVAEAELECVHFHVHILELKRRRPVLLDQREVHGHRQALAAEENVGVRSPTSCGTRTRRHACRLEPGTQSVSSQSRHLREAPGPA
jgi:hypothetical protein